MGYLVQDMVCESICHASDAVGRHLFGRPDLTCFMFCQGEVVAVARHFLFEEDVAEDDDFSYHVSKFEPAPRRPIGRVGGPEY